MKLSRNNVRLAIWLIGLGILWITNEWWPGILILFGIGMIVDRVMKTNPTDIDKNTPEDLESKDTLPQNFDSRNSKDQVPSPEEPIPPQAKPGPSRQMNLPPNCPRCGAPIKIESDLNGGQYECPFCGSRLIPS